MGTAYKMMKSGLFFMALVVIAAFISSSAWAAPTVTICGSKATRDVTTGSSDKIGASEKLKSDGNPLFASFSTDVANSGATYTAKQEVNLIAAPRAGCSLDKIVVNTDGDCRPIPASETPSDPHPVEVHFKNCSSAGQTVYFPDVPADSDAITPANALENNFNAAKTLLGLNSLVWNEDCDSPFASPPSPQNLSCAASICDGIKDQIENGGALALTTAGDLGQLIGSLQSTVGVCFADSDFVEVDSGGAGCTGSDIARTGALDVFLDAPEISIQLDSAGAGVFSLANLDGNGDTATIDMSTCVADWDLDGTP